MTEFRPYYVADIFLPPKLRSSTLADSLWVLYLGRQVSYSGRKCLGDLFLQNPIQALILAEIAKLNLSHFPYKFHDCSISSNFNFLIQKIRMTFYPYSFPNLKNKCDALHSWLYIFCLEHLENVSYAKLTLQIAALFTASFILGTHMLFLYRPLVRSLRAPTSFLCVGNDELRSDSQWHLTATKRESNTSKRLK